MTNKILALKDNYMIVVDETTREVLKYSPLLYLREHRKTDGKKITPCASCILVSAEKQYFLITAGHVIEENDPEDLGILIENVFNILIGEMRYINPYLDEKSDKIDIAVWKLDEKIANILKQRYKFLPIEKLGLNHELILDEPRYLVVGFPWRKSKPNPISKIIRPKPLVFAGKVATEDAYKELHLERHTNIVLNYLQRKIVNGKTGFVRKGVKPEGISGCGIWYIDKFIYLPSEGPCFKLLSIVTVRYALQNLIVIVWKERNELTLLNKEKNRIIQELKENKKLIEFLTQNPDLDDEGIGSFTYWLTSHSTVPDFNEKEKSILKLKDEIKNKQYSIDLLSSSILQIAKQ